MLPTLGVWERFDDIDFDALPNQFVLKTNHGGGSIGVVICKDKNIFDVEKARIKLEHSLRTDAYTSLREWSYKNVKRRIFAEPYVIDEATGELRDYKFFCFNGHVRCFKVDFNRFSDHHANYFDRDGLLLPFGEKNYPPVPQKELKMPCELSKMITLAEYIAKGKSFVRVDFYNADGRIYFGEITFFPAGGMGQFTPEEWDNTLGSWIKLPETKI